MDLEAQIRAGAEQQRMSLEHPAILFATLAVLGSCTGGHDPYTDDQPTKGIVRLVADTDLKDIVEAQHTVFEGLYSRATLRISYLPEAELLRTMGADSIRCTITYALPGQDQDSTLRDRRVLARPVPIFIDGIAVIAHPALSKLQLDLRAVRALLTDSSSGPTPLFAGSGSGVARSLMDSLGIRITRAQALPDLDAVVDRVAQDSSVLGFVAFNALADLDDPRMRAIRERVRLVPIAPPDGSPALVPSQASLADGRYPLRRVAYMVLTEGKSGLGTGFVSFVANQKGQRIMLKRGIAPIRVQPRNVEIVAPR